MDPWFYDKPGRGPGRGQAYDAARREAPDGWARASDDHWVIYSPAGHDLPAQGWKVHVAGRLDNAERVIDAAWAFCTARGVPFKFLCGPTVVLARNAKYADRGGSGKLVTIYPADEAELEVVCKGLDAVLAGEVGPTILSDLRWGAGPVHVRYGGFTHRSCRDARGQEVPAIEDASGTLVPDVRGPVFAVPPWVELPDCLTEHLEARGATTVGDIPFDVTSALHFSNGGGVYTGVDKRTGERVVLKEARPHAGLSGDGDDAVTRLRRERDALQRLAGLAAIPRFVDYLIVGDHEFLVMEFVEGEPLKSVLGGKYPLLDRAATGNDLTLYTEWALNLHRRVAAVVASIHERGMVYGDLHMFNVMVRPTGEVALLDFEVCHDVRTGGRAGLGAVGFAAPRDWAGPDVDRYALACLKLALFAPLQPLLGLDRSKAVGLARLVEASFPVPDGWLDDAVETIARSAPPGAAPAPAVAEAPRLGTDGDAWCRVRASIAAGILAAATPERDDRLFPGDVAQFRAGATGGLNLAHGAAGVLHALDAVGAERAPDLEEWLVRRAADPGPDARFGLYDGLHGIAHVLYRLGHHDAAAAALDRCLDRGLDGYGDDLYGGVPGMGLHLAHVADLTGDAAAAEAAERATRLVADRTGAVDDVARTSGGDHPHAGLMQGGAGRALLFVAMYERTGEPALLDHAATALRQDLRRTVRRSSDGALHVDEGWRTMPYLAAGSAGVGLVLHRYLAHRHDDELAEAAHAVRIAACAPFYVQAGLFGGRAGMVLYLADGRRPGEPPDADLADQACRLEWHALSRDGHLAFPGEQLLRLSADLATGSAGVLLALGAALHDAPVHLPLLGPPPSGRPGAGPTIHDQERR